MRDVYVLLGLTLKAQYLFQPWLEYTPVLKVSSKTWNKPKVENMLNISVHDATTSPNVNYIRWKVHGDWVTQLNYHDAIKAVISSSDHEPTALVIDENQSEVCDCTYLEVNQYNYNGEIIVWNVISGHMYCKLNTPSPRDGTEGRGGAVTFWRLFGGACPIANFTPSRDKAQISRITVTAEDTFAYIADQEGFVQVYDIKKYGLQGPEMQPPKNVTFWRAHVSLVTSVDRRKVSAVILCRLHCAPVEQGRRVRPSWLGQSRPPRKAPELVRPAIYQTLRCHDIACMSARGEKPDLSILGSDLFNLNFLTQEKEGNEAAQEEP
ncbi:Wd Repeat-Containing Protein 49 [Manis pentadactyla]|nr:Wd Repeat-Containing Protein 49 [Manis pentadactyla]